MKKTLFSVLLFFLFAMPAQSERIYQGYNGIFTPTNPRIDFIQNETGDILSATRVTAQNTFQISQFDPSLGTLERVFFSFSPEVKITLSAATEPGERVGPPNPLIGNETESTIIAQGTYSSSLTVDAGLPGLASQIFNDIVFHAGCTTPLVYIGQFPDFGNYDSCTGIDYNNDNRVKAYLDSNDPADLSAFIGTGTFDIIQDMTITLDDLSGDPGYGYFDIDNALSTSEQGLFFYDYVPFITEPLVPVPAAVWLFGSGLIGLIAMARRKKA